MPGDAAGAGVGSGAGADDGAGGNDGTVVEAGTGGGAGTGGVAAVGILMLETRFPRIAGDAGNPATWPFPVRFRVVRDATPERVVRHAAQGLLDRFIEAAKSLVADGVDGITTSCGFLALHQSELAAACGVPVAASSLAQIPAVQSLLPPGKRVGVLTICAASLTQRHLACAGAPPDTPVEGTDAGTELSRVILGDETALDVERARADVLAAGRRLLARDPSIGALVLECTNMPPYAADLCAALGVPVYDFYGFVCWFQSGLRPRRWRA